MTQARKDAYRRILYAAMLDFRSHWPLSPYRAFPVLKPWVWWRGAKRLVKIQVMADWLHNLAMFAASDFDGFNEERFWKESNGIVRRFPELAPPYGLYRVLFENDRSSREGKSRTWGVVEDA